MTSLFTPKGFLMWGGVVLVLIAILGYVGVIGPTAEQSIFGAFWYFDNAENIAHLVLGVVALLAVYVLSSGMQKWLVLIIGAVAVLVGLYNFGSTELFGANLESPADMLLHLVVGAWALYAGMSKSSMSMGETPVGMGGM